MCLIANQKPVRNSRVGSNPTPSAFMPIAQWIEHIPPKNGIQVRFLLGIHKNLLIFLYGFKILCYNSSPV